MRTWPRLLVAVGTVCAVLSVTSVAFASHFTDTAGSTHAANINWLETSGITGGCGGTNYCPDAPVTRAQMATFIRRLSGNDPKVDPIVVAKSSFTSNLADSATTAGFASTAGHSATAGSASTADSAVSASMADFATSSAHSVDADSARRVDQLIPVGGSVISDGLVSPAAKAGNVLPLFDDENITINLVCDDGNDSQEGDLDLTLSIEVTSKKDDQAILTSVFLNDQFNSGVTETFATTLVIADDFPTLINSSGQEGTNFDPGFIFNPTTGDYYSIGGESMMMFYDGTNCQTAFPLMTFNING